ncbi:MAG: TIGR03619 family F420-dependent LLM class oxidoreductase [Actinomycetota bacterium]|jgi:probable F420-dependent oxidoreductase|nr:TIGR03619 family F420-dependent LLM class oxidoreductase [Actinomycetota bacterium]
MNIGVVFPCNEIGGDTGAIRAYTEAAEDLGFAHFEVFDHVVGEPDNYAGRLWREPFVLLSYLAAITERIELVTGIIILPQRQTALAAKQVADLDLLSDGRLRLGLGVGWNPFEYEALDQDFSRRGRRMDEQIAALRTLWSQQVVDVDIEIGNEHIHGGGVHPVPGREIPIWIGGRSDAAMRRAVTGNQGWLSNFQDHLGNDRDDFIAAKAQLVAAAGGQLPAGFGIEAWTSPGRTDPDTWASEAAEWKALGVTHLSLRTDESRNNQPPGNERSLDEHIALLSSYQEALGSLRI